MSALQIGLLCIGLVVLIALGVHSFLTTRRNLPRLPEEESRFHPDPLLYPGLNDPVPAAGSGPSIDKTDKADRAERKVLLDPMLDVLADIELEHPVPGEAVLAHMPATRRVGSKPYAVEGWSEDGWWESPQPGGMYRALRAGVQLANRAGALNEIEYSEFVMKTQTLADALAGATTEFADMRDAIARARELDVFASENDVQLSITLRARGAAWSAGYVQQHAARVGFIPGVLPGRMVQPMSSHHATVSQPPLLSLQYDPLSAQSADPLLTAIRSITLMLDVTQVPRAEQPYARMRAVAARLAETMGGDLVDDEGRALSEAALGGIAHELERLYDRLDARDIPAGSALARRLFS